MRSGGDSAVTYSPELVIKKGRGFESPLGAEVEVYTDVHIQTHKDIHTHTHTHTHIHSSVQ